MPQFDVTCAIPRAGRTLVNFLNKLKTLGANPQEIDQILEVIQQSKKHSSPQIHKVLDFLQAVSHQAPPCFGIYIDRKRTERPYRVGFIGYEWDINGLRVRVEGDEPHNGSSLIKLDEIDFTIVGLDELLSMTQYYLREPTPQSQAKRVTKWGMYNYHLEKPTGIRIAGSAKLTSYNKTLQREIQDIVGFFLISKPGGQGKYPTNLENLARFGQRVFVKGRYTGIVTAAYPKLKVASVEDVEEAVMNAEKGSVGIEIVQSGNTLKQKNLILHGAPLFLSESLYVVDYDRFQGSEPLRRLIEALQPQGYFEEERIEHFAAWYRALELNLGASWIDKPQVTQLFCEPEDAENGLRPYRLQTRHWKPSDEYKREDALALIESSREKLLSFYQALVAQTS